VWGLYCQFIHIQSVGSLLYVTKTNLFRTFTLNLFVAKDVEEN
jgi:hypothetical protein